MPKIDPTTETPLQRASGSFPKQVAYYRAYETRKVNDCGQDYIHWAEQDNSLTFALCDGVSLSFFGELAAQMLGEQIVTLLSDDTDFGLHIQEQQLAERFENALNEYAQVATNQIQHFQLPEHLPDVVKEVLEQKRRLGSECTFVCGRIDRSSNQNEHIVPGRLLLFWLGDSRLRIWNGGQEVRLDPSSFITAQRWSTTRGCVGEAPHCSCIQFQSEEIETLKIIAYSDGLSLFDDQDLANLELSRKHAQIVDASNHPSSDDISYLEISLEHTVQGTTVDSIAMNQPHTDSKMTHGSGKSWIQRLMQWMKNEK